MAKVTYRGPGDAVELDGLRIERGKTTELVGDQITRLRASDPRAVVEVDPTPDTPRDVVRIRAEQAKQREDRADAALKDEIETGDAVETAERAAAELASKRADERERVRADAVRSRQESASELRSTPKREKGAA